MPQTQQFEAVLFDYAGVLTNGYVEADYPGELSERFGISIDEFRQAARAHRIFANMSLGLLTEDAAIELIRTDLPHAKRVDRSAFRTQFYDPHPEVMAAIDTFRARSTAKLAVVSNIWPECVEYLQSIGADDHFDVMFYSCEVGDSKPEASFFRHVSDTLEVDPAACLFFDDALNNVEGARAVGMTAIHVQSQATVIETLASIGQ